MLEIHIIGFLVLIFVFNRIRKRAKGVDALSQMWLERCLSLETENASLRQIICRYENGHPVPEAEIDSIMGHLRSIGLIK